MTTPVRSAQRRIASTFVSGTLATTALVLLPATAATAATAQPPPEPTGIMRTAPFSNGGIMNDNEGSAYVKSDDSLWLVQDTGKIFEVDATTGERRRTIAAADLSTVPLHNGGPGAPTAVQRNYWDMESIAYDATNDVLYVFSGSNIVGTDIPTVFRLTRQGGSLQLLDYQPLPTPETDFTASAWNPVDGKLYVGKGSWMQTYDFATNTAGPLFRVGNLTNILGLDFSPDGSELFVSRTKTSSPRAVEVVKADWASKTVSWRLDVQGDPDHPWVRDARAVAYVDGALYVSDGYDDPNNPPNEHAVYIFGQRASTPITAHIKADVTSGAAPLKVNFTDESTGAPTAWSWTFGDGSAASTDRNPTHTFAAPGIYTVTLVASSMTNRSRTTMQIEAKDLYAPTASYAVPGGEVWAGYTKVTLDETVLHDDFTPTAEIKRSVTWGDGATTTGLSHVYRSAGAYEPQVRLTDNAGNSQTIAAGTVTVASDTAGPVVNLRRPRHAAAVRSWRVLRGTAVDAGTGVRSVKLRVVEKRGRTWFAYRATTRSWVPARTLGAALRRSRPATLAPTSAAWGYRVPGMRKGYLVVKVWGFDKVRNSSGVKTYTQRITRR